MTLFPKEPKLQANGQYDMAELDKYIGDVSMTVFIGSLVAIAAMAIPTLIVAHKRGKEMEAAIQTKE